MGQEGSKSTRAMVSSIPAQALLIIAVFPQVYGCTGRQSGWLLFSGSFCPSHFVCRKSMPALSRLVKLHLGGQREMEHMPQDKVKEAFQGELVSFFYSFFIFSYS